MPLHIPMQVTSRDGFYCLECSSSGFNPQTSQCNPCLSNTQIFSKSITIMIYSCISTHSTPPSPCPASLYPTIVDVLPSNQTDLGNRSCVECPHGYWADSAGFSCVQCGLSDCTQCVSRCSSLFPPLPTHFYPFLLLILLLFPNFLSTLSYLQHPFI